MIRTIPTLTARVFDNTHKSIVTGPAGRLDRRRRVKNIPQDAAGFAKWLLDKGACSEARRWADGKSLPEIWESCERGDWLEWLLDAVNYKWAATALAEYQRVKATKIHELIPYPFKSDIP